MSENKHTPEPMFQYQFRQLATYENGRTPVLLTEAQYCRAKSCIDACAGMTSEQVSHGIVSASVFSSVVQQRDELLAALGSGWRHCNDDTPHSDLCEAIIDSKEADLGQGLDPFWKWAFRRGFHEAETSYKVDIATLEQQRDELLAEIIHIQQVACSGSQNSALQPTPSPA